MQLTQLSITQCNSLPAQLTSYLYASLILLISHGQADICWNEIYPDLIGTEKQVVELVVLRYETVFLRKI